MLPSLPRPGDSQLELGNEKSLHPRALLFRNRLRKNLRRLTPWAAQQGLEAYRLYDSDIPEVRLIVERYGDSLVVWEYVRRADLDPLADAGTEAERQRFLGDVLAVLVKECGVAPANIFLKCRRRQRTGGVGQYEPLPQQHAVRLIREGGYRFLVNLSDYLDTGLFLDHRETRALVGRMSANKRVLNLFGYTGSFTVYAAGGGCKSSVTVDLSPTYLDWAGRNFAENGLDTQRHRLLRADVLHFLRAPHAPHVLKEERKFDLIILDPPTFSNSKRMRGTLDVERDHPWLIGQALELLEKGESEGAGKGGVLLFSSNNRRFTLRAGEIPSLSGGDAPAASIRDLSAETLPRDFHNQRTRCCYLIRRD